MSSGLPEAGRKGAGEAQPFLKPTHVTREGAEASEDRQPEESREAGSPLIVDVDDTSVRTPYA